MFEEVKEMIDSTIYTNGRGEVTAQNVNLAMHGMVDATEEKFDEVNDAVKAVEDKVTALEENATGGGAGALKVWMPIYDASSELTPEQIAENVATYNEIVKGEPVSVVICMAESVDGITAVGTIPTTASYTDFGGNKTVALLANQFVHGDITAILGQLFSDGSVAMTTEIFVVPSSSGPLYIVTDNSTEGSSLTDEQKSDNVRTYNILMSGENVPVYMVTQFGGTSSIQTMLQTLINREENIVQLASFRYNGQGGVIPMTVTLYSDGTYSVA